LVKFDSDSDGGDSPDEDYSQGYPSDLGALDRSPYWEPPAPTNQDSHNPRQSDFNFTDNFLIGQTQQPRRLSTEGNYECNNPHASTHPQEMINIQNYQTPFIGAPQNFDSHDYPTTQFESMQGLKAPRQNSTDKKGDYMSLIPDIMADDFSEFIMETKPNPHIKNPTISSAQPKVGYSYNSSPSSTGVEEFARPQPIRQTPKDDDKYLTFNNKSADKKVSKFEAIASISEVKGKGVGGRRAKAAPVTGKWTGDGSNKASPLAKKGCRVLKGASNRGIEVRRGSGKDYYHSLMLDEKIWGKEESLRNMEDQEALIAGSLLKIKEEKLRIKEEQLILKEERLNLLESQVSGKSG
jgi:hypothetical protein